MLNGYFLAVGIPVRCWILLSLSDKNSRTNAGAFWRSPIHMQFSTIKISVCKFNMLKGEGLVKFHWRSRITSFYFLVDILRAIHLNTPPSFNQTDLSFPLTASSAGRFEDLYRQIIVNRQNLHPDLTPDEYLLALLCILSETVQLLRFLGPFADETIQNSRKGDYESENSYVDWRWRAIYIIKADWRYL